MTPDQRRAYVLTLADELGVVLIVDREDVCSVVPCEGRNDPHGYALHRRRPWRGAGVLPPFVVLSHEPGKSSEAFLVALHELGHVAKGRKGPTKAHEAFAWRFALKHAGASESPSTHIWARIERDLRSYETYCRRCKPIKDFDRLLREAERKAK